MSITPTNTPRETVDEIVVSPLSNADQDVTPILLDAVERCRNSGAKRLLIEPGVYHAYSTLAFERYSWISNHDRGLRRTALPIIGFDGLEIDATGARLVLHGQSFVSLMIIDSKDIVIRGLTIDRDQPLHFQAEVTHTHPKLNAFDIDVIPECQAQIKDGILTWGEDKTNPLLQNRAPFEPWQLNNSYQWRQDTHWNHWLDPHSLKPSAAQPALDWNNEASKVESLGEHRFRLFGTLDTLPAIGQTLIAKGLLSANRTSPGIHVLGCETIDFEDLTIHHAGGMGIIAEDSSDLTLRRVRITPNPQSGFRVSTTADATHFNACRGVITVEDCLFENQLDDAINVHSVYAPVAAASDDHRIIIKFTHFQQLGLRFARPGDRLRFSRRSSLEQYSEASVRSTRFINQDHVEIAFETPVAAWLQPDSVVDNADTNPDLFFRRNRCLNNRARFMLLSTGGKVQVEYNHMENASISSIFFEADAEFWHEAGPVNNAVFIGNTIAHSNPRTAVIRFSPRTQEHPEQLSSFYRNITFKNNAITTVSPTIIDGARVENLVFTENAIEFLNERQAGTPSVNLVASTNTTIEKNPTSDGRPL